MFQSGQCKIYFFMATFLLAFLSFLLSSIIKGASTQRMGKIKWHQNRFFSWWWTLLSLAQNRLYFQKIFIVSFAGANTPSYTLCSTLDFNFLHCLLVCVLPPLFSVSRFPHLKQVDMQVMRSPFFLWQMQNWSERFIVLWGTNLRNRENYGIVVFHIPVKKQFSLLPLNSLSKQISCSTCLGVAKRMVETCESEVYKEKQSLLSGNNMRQSNMLQFTISFFAFFFFVVFPDTVFFYWVDTAGFFHLNFKCTYSMIILVVGNCRSPFSSSFSRRSRATILLLMLATAASITCLVKMCSLVYSLHTRYINVLILAKIWHIASNNSIIL